MFFVPLLFILLTALWCRGRLDGWIAEDRPKPKAARTVRGVGMLVASGVAALSAVGAVLLIGHDGRELTGVGWAFATGGGMAFVALQSRGTAAFLAQAIESRAAGRETGESSRSPGRPQ